MATYSAKTARSAIPWTRCQHATFGEGRCHDRATVELIEVLDRVPWIGRTAFRCEEHRAELERVGWVNREAPDAR